MSVLSVFEQYTLAVAPDVVQQFILENASHQVKKHSDSDTTGEGYDYRMEEAKKGALKNYVILL